MLAALGDLVEDVIVRLGGPINVASDTQARISRRQGGSAANVAAMAAHLGFPARFIGQVGVDSIGTALLADLAGCGVDVSSVRRSGSTGTVVALVDETGERSMLSDRQTCIDLADPDPAWLELVSVLHVPFYSLVLPPLATSASTMIGWAHERGIPVSIDASSVAIIKREGADAVRNRLATLAPAVILANADEAAVLHLDDPVGDSLSVIKRGPRSAIVLSRSLPATEVPAIDCGRPDDTTGAGDAFAAGFLTHASHAGWRASPLDACAAGHSAAARLLSTRVPPAPTPSASAP
jgi:sugar/nucleoside kinase (ribokinase family)